MIKKLKLTQYESIGGWETITVENLIKIAEKINEIIDTLSKPSVETPKEPLSFNCTLAKFAEQLDVPLWKAMEFGKYFKPSIMSVEEIRKVLMIEGANWEMDNSADRANIGKNTYLAQAIHNFIMKGCSQ